MRNNANEEINVHTEAKSASKDRIDLNDLLSRIKNQKKEESKTNLIIVSGAIVVSVIVVLILSF